MLRIPIGVGLAILVYFLLRGGFMTVPSGGGNGARPEDYVNPFGFAGVAGLTGMFSKQATDKLQELFDTLFRTNEDAQRDDKLDDVRDEALTLRKIDPEQATVGASGQTVTLTGQFYDTDLVMVDGVPQRFDIARDGTTMSLALDDDKFASAGEIKISVLRAHPKTPQRKDGTITILHV